MGTGGGKWGDADADDDEDDAFDSKLFDNAGNYISWQ